MHSSGENSRKRKNDSVKRGEYRNFDQMSSQMRETLIESCAEKVIAHAAENGGRCRLGFVKELVGKVSQRAPLLEITRDDINNRVRIIKGQRKEEEQRDVSPAIPFHIIRDPSLSTNSDLSVSASSNEQNPLDILASQAVQTFENTNQWGIQVRVIVVKEQVLLEKKIGWLTCINLTMRDRPRCSGRNHEFLHEPPVLSVRFAAQRLESLQ